MTSIFEGQPPKQGLFQSKQGVVWVPGMHQVLQSGIVWTHDWTHDLHFGGSKFGHFEEARIHSLTIQSNVISASQSFFPTNM